VCFPPSSAAEENPEVYENILIAVSPLVENRDPELESLISEALQVEFQRAGLEVTILSDLPRMGAAVGLEDILPVARTEGFDLAGACGYLEEESGVRIELACGDTQNIDISAEVSTTTTVNLSLDTVFTEAVGRIIERIEAMTPGKNFDPERRDDPGEETAAEEQPDREIESPERRERFFLSFGSAPFLALGKTNLYFNIGILSSLHGNYLFPTRAGDIGIGLYVGVNYFQATGLILSATNLLLPLGVDIHYGTSSEQTIRLFLHLTGGMSIFLLLPDNADVLSKMVPYFSAGVGAGIQFKRLVAVELDASFFMFFEEYYPIMGLAPSLHINFRF
jgi:hypothetical protein